MEYFSLLSYVMMANNDLYLKLRYFKSYQSWLKSPVLCPAVDYCNQPIWETVHVLFTSMGVVTSSWAILRKRMGCKVDTAAFTCHNSPR